MIFARHQEERFNIGREFAVGERHLELVFEIAVGAQPAQQPAKSEAPAQQLAQSETTQNAAPAQPAAPGLPGLSPSGIPDIPAAVDVDSLKTSGESKFNPASMPKRKKIGPNDPCPCGSGLKYKKCHGKP